ncbi:MAG: sensor histidine kinase [Acidobacteriota bacterium]
MFTARGARGTDAEGPAHGAGPDWEFEAARGALLGRPRVSIRLRLSVGLALCFLLCAAVVWTSQGARPASPAEADLANRVPLLLLALLFLAFVAIAFLFDRALMGPIRRFESYTSRVARGDFSPIGPTRWYRDEFTDLALAVNSMLRELEAQQNQMVQAAKLTTVGTLTSGIAHELNNPLNNIAITTEALMEDFKRLSEGEKWKLLQDIYFETERAGEIVKSLLDFTREERPESVPVSLAEVVESTRRLLHNEMDLSGVRFAAEIPEDLPTVRAAVNPLRQVFLNLFINAVHAMPRGGTLSVRAMRTDSERVCVDVTDTGTGIPAEVLPRIFDPFFTTKEPGKGTGLGLSVSLGILRKYGGEMRVVSEVGKGTTFHVCLPVMETSG